MLRRESVLVSLNKVFSLNDQKIGQLMRSFFAYHIYKEAPLVFYASEAEFCLHSQWEIFALNSRIKLTEQAGKQK